MPGPAHWPRPSPPAPEADTGARHEHPHRRPDAHRPDLPPYFAGLESGRADAAAATPEVTAVRRRWISEYADAEYAAGYRDGLRFDRDPEQPFRTRTGRA
ncbi:hypothetical protein O1L60_44775 [Streptomyces diastatochromogenes]|nr:hypothetical protein [Streptomyces diastatochromogenes]